MTVEIPEGSCLDPNKRIVRKIVRCSFERSSMMFSALFRSCPSRFFKDKIYIRMSQI
jgi:hypothetical protein